MIRALQGRLNDKPTPHEKGFLFETWFVNEISHLNDYHELDLKLSLWREKDWEIDLLIEKKGRPVLAVEIKSGQHFREEPSWAAFQARFPKVPFIIASLADERPRKIAGRFEVLPFMKALRRVIEI